VQNEQIIIYHMDDAKKHFRMSKKKLENSLFKFLDKDKLNELIGSDDLKKYSELILDCDQETASDLVTKYFDSKKGQHY